MINPIVAIRALFTTRSVVTQEIQEAKTMNGSKPGWKTTEFWVKIFTVDAPLLWGVVHSFVPPALALKVELAATAVYTIARVINKAVADIQAGSSTVSAAPAVATATASVAAQ